MPTRVRRPLQFALPGLLYRNLASSNLYDADWSIVFASLVFKVLTGVAIFAISWVLRARSAGPVAERSLVVHSVLTFPNYVVIGARAERVCAAELGCDTARTQAHQCCPASSLGRL